MLRNQTITPHPAYLLAWLPAHYSVLTLCRSHAVKSRHLNQFA
jgi:hypothetical protein